jgi:tRNA-dihydrouridine synthase
MYTGHADWDILKEVASQLHIPFMGNGDVRTPQDAKRMLDEVGADAVMIGRAVLGNPWELQKVAAYLNDGTLIDEPTPAEKIKIAKEHLHGLVELKGENIGPREFRGQAAYYLKGVPHSARTKVALNAAETEQEMIDIFDRFIEKLDSRMSRVAK